MPATAYQSDTSKPEVPQQSLVQAAAIPQMIQGGDVLLASHTGSGKTLAYLLPLVRLCGKVSLYCACSRLTHSAAPSVPKKSSHCAQSSAFLGNTHIIYSHTIAFLHCSSVIRVQPSVLSTLCCSLASKLACATHTPKAGGVSGAYAEGAGAAWAAEQAKAAQGSCARAHTGAD